jgi:hypothetical protein
VTWQPRSSLWHEKLLRWVLFIAGLLLLVPLTFCPGVWSADSTLSERVSQDSFSSDPTSVALFDTDKKILLECIKLIQFNVRFHQEANRRWWWRDWLYPMEKEAATGLTFANSMVDIKQRTRGLDNTDLISKNAERKGLNCDVTGHALGGTSSALELAQNGIVALMARHKGFSPKQSVKYVKGGIDIIDNLLRERERLVTAGSTAEQPVRVLQGRLLKHIRNQVIFEFTQWSINSREVAWRENVFFLIDTMQNYTNVGSGIFSNYALKNSNNEGASAIASLVAHSMETANPVIRTFAGHCIGRYQRWRLAKVFPETEPRTMKKIMDEWQNLDQLLATNSTSTNDQIKELAFLVRKSQNFDGALADEERSIEHLRRVADQQAISGPLIGLTKIADSTTSVVARYELSNNHVVSNEMKLGGKISDASGEGYSLLATPTAKVLHYRYTRRLAREGKLPSQIMHERLIKLDQLQQKITAARP